MATYYFRATDSQGKVQTGHVEVSSKALALQHLEKQGLFPILVSSKQQRKDFNIQNIDLERYLPSRRIGGGQLLDFTDKLATLLKAGLPLARALNLLIETTSHQAMKEVVQQVLKDVSAGKSLAESLAKHPHVFGRLYVNMVRTGEAAGVLELILENLRDYTQTRQEMKAFLISSLIYPAILLVTGIGTVLVLVMFVLPRFQEVFQQVGQELPFVTAIMVDITGFLSRYKWILLIVLVAAIYGFRAWKNTDEGRKSWDQFKLRLPALGSIFQQIEVTRFANALGILLKSSVSLLDAMSIAKEIMQNRIFQLAMDPMIKGIKKGEGMSLPMVHAGVFPKMAIHLVKVGEETGTLGEMFEKVARIYQANLQKNIKRFLALFEPAMILLMFVVVGFIVAAMLMAVTSLSTTAM